MGGAPGTEELDRGPYESNVFQRKLEKMDAQELVTDFAQRNQNWHRIYQGDILLRDV